MDAISLKQAETLLARAKRRRKVVFWDAVSTGTKVKRRGCKEPDVS
jgi:hypothetical protein